MVLSDTFSIECFESFDGLFELEVKPAQLEFFSQVNRTAKRFYDLFRSRRGEKIFFVELGENFDRDTILKLYLIMVLKLGSDVVTLSHPSPDEYFIVYRG